MNSTSGPFREASAFGAGIDRCVVIGIVAAHKNCTGSEQIDDGPSQDFGNPPAERHSHQSALYEFSRRTAYMAKLEEAACLPRRRQNRREHRPEELSDGPTAFSFHPNPGVYQVYNHQPRTRVQGFGNGGKSIHAKRQPRTIFFKAPCQYSESAPAKYL